MKMVAILVFMTGVLFKAAGQNATEIVSKADKKMRGAAMQAEMVIRTIRLTGQGKCNAKPG